MHHHSGGLIDNKEGFVLKNDFDRDFLTEDRALFHAWDLDANRFTDHRLVTRSLTPPVDEHVSVCDQGRGLRPRQVGTPGHKQIEADITVRLDGVLPNVVQG